MDKRLSIALLLTAIIVAVTPILFPTPRKPTPASVSPPVAESQGATSQAPPVAAPSPPATNAVSPRVSPAVSPDSSGAISLTAATVTTSTAEMTTIETSKSIYKFSNLGAVPVSVVLRDYKNLSSAGGPVDLKLQSESLLRYALVLNADTISLSGIPFQISESKAPSGHQLLTYRTAVQNANIAISYEIVPDKYVLKIAGRVDGVSGQPFLLIQLPSSLPAQETDTLSDLRALSYSF